MKITRKLSMYVSMLTLCLVSFTTEMLAQSSYRVLVASYAQAVPSSHFGDLNTSLTVKYGAMHKYYVRNIGSLSEAEAIQSKAISMGFDNARVINEAEITANQGQCCYTIVSSNVQLVSYPDPVVTPTPVDDAPMFHNVFFDFDKSFVRQKHKSELQELARYLSNNPNYSVEVHAHTDSKGSQAYNKALANRRKQAVIDYLASRGVPSARIKGNIYGEDNPIAQNELNTTDNPQGRQLNRRVELRIVDAYGNPVNLVEQIFVPAGIRR